MAKINRNIMLILKVLLSSIMSVITLYQLIVSNEIGDIVFWLLALLFCIVNTIEYSRRDYEK